MALDSPLLKKRAGCGHGARDPARTEELRLESQTSHSPPFSLIATLPTSIHELDFLSSYFSDFVKQS